jgi:ketosteroid isomerase-like protein
MESHAKHVVREFIKAVNSNDVDRVMSFYTKDAQLWDPPDCNPCKGRALRRVEVRDAADHFHVNVSQLKANGNVVSGKFKATSDSIRKSGMRRVTGTFEMTLRGDKIAVLRVHPATS